MQKLTNASIASTLRSRFGHYSDAFLETTPSHPCSRSKTLPFAAGKQSKSRTLSRSIDSSLAQCSSAAE